MYSACEVTLLLLDTLIDHLTYLLTKPVQRSCHMITVWLIFLE